MPVKQIVTTLLFYFFFVSVKGQTSRALLVAIDKYSSESGWNEIHATNDIYLLKPLLIKRNFAPAHVTVLLNEQATKDAIVKALKQLAKDSRHGDYIYIHFSCHGQQMADDNGDETDGLDEALIPYDAPRRYQKGVYVGEKHLRDDELGSLLDDIRKKTGDKGTVTLALDACHSGTADRDKGDDVYVRGTSYVFAPKDFVPPAVVCTDSTLKEIYSQPGMASMTVIAACMPEQLNYEYRSPHGFYYGSLTYALWEIMRKNESLPFSRLCELLKNRVDELKPRRGKTQIPLLKTNDEKGIFRIGI